MIHLKEKIVLLISVIFLFTGLQVAPGAINKTGEVLGIGILKRISGLCHGPVYSSTPAGSFESWHVYSFLFG